jgi:TatD DNase family protein
MQLFDAHSHLQSRQFDADRAEVLHHMKEQGVGSVVIGTDLEMSKSALALAAGHDFLWAAVGLHPNDNKDEHFDISKYEELAQDPKVVAIGECGLDYFRSGNTPEEKLEQKARFVAQGNLAQKLNKALIIHCRDAHEDMLITLGEQQWDMPIVIHFCTVTGEIAQRYLDIGCYLSFPGPVTYADMYDDSIKAAPLDKILVETDAPFAAPMPYRGKRNEPVYVREVLKKVAALKEVSLEKMEAEALNNAQKVFNISFSK